MDHPAALLALRIATFEALHPACDNWCQRSDDALDKRNTGRDLVHPWTGQPTPSRWAVTRDTRAWISAGRHAITHEALNFGGFLALARLCGLRVPAGAVLAASAVNVITHAALDRGPLMRAFVRLTRKQGYVDFGTVVRQPGGPAGTVGPGTAWMVLDDAAHRALAVLSAAVLVAVARRR